MANMLDEGTFHRVSLKYMTIIDHVMVEIRKIYTPI